MSAPGLGARTAAHEALGQTLRRKRPLDAALDESVAAHKLVPRDAGFARAIANETMRRFGQLDDLVRRFVPKPPPPHRAGPTFEILLAGACELLWLDVAAHAAVDGANRLAAADPKAVHFKPLINAALRRIAREGKAVTQTQDAGRLNTPDWLWSRWCEIHGEEITRAIAAVHAQTPPLDINFPSANPGDAVAPREHEVGSARDVFLRDLRDSVASTELPGGILRLHNPGAVEALPGFAEGAFWIQGFAASLPARLLGDVRGQRVIDLCAAPGGKTAQLCSLGARVSAVDRDETRVGRLSDNLARLKMSARLVASDVRDFQPDEPAPFVLLDAPCSATGTIRRHPEIPWIKGAADVASCADGARELLESAAAMVASGGTLVFAVCSLEPEEGSEQVGHFLRRNEEFRRLPIVAGEVFGRREWIDESGDLRTLPCHFAECGGMGGFYAARLRRS